MSKLSPRQRELILLVAGGLAIKEAADRMGVTHSEGKNLYSRARKKLGYRTSQQMMFELGRERV